MFNWFSGKSNNNLPEPTALQNQRSKQIEQLKALGLDVSEIQRDVEYRINTVVQGNSISIFISLPPQFPQEKPLVKVSPRLSHPWVNDQMIIVGSPGLNKFVVHSDLGKEIREVIEEFQRNPPVMQPQQFSAYGGYPYGGSSAVTSTNPTVTGATQPSVYGYPAQTTQHQANYMPNVPQPTTGIMSASYSTTQGPPNFGIPNLVNDVQAQSTFGSYKMPDLPTSLKSQLQHFSVQELQELLDNEDKLLHIIGDQPEIQKISTDREGYTQSNEQMARSNLAVKPLLEEKKKVLLEKYDIFNDVKQQYDRNADLQDELRQKFDPRRIQDHLKIAAQQAEELSEFVAESFLEGTVPVEEFKKNYMDKRKLSHLRHAKEERLGQMRLSTY